MITDIEKVLFEVNKAQGGGSSRGDPTRPPEAPEEELLEIGKTFNEEMTNRKENRISSIVSRMKNLMARTSRTPNFPGKLENSKASRGRTRTGTLRGEVHYFTAPD